ncbi:MAG: hypothetical protein WKF47_10655 [Geodermatophilaceae bacterium]
MSTVVPWPELPERHLLSAELLEHVDTLIAALPARQWEAVIARDVLGLGARRGSAPAGQSASAHWVAVHRGRYALRAALERLLRDAGEQAAAADGP